jgi:hypothetical protein
LEDLYRRRETDRRIAGGPPLFQRIFIVSVLLFVAAFGAHEVMHLLVIYVVGSSGAIVARPWHFGYVDLTIPSLHAQPSGQLDVVRQSIVNFFGPFLAAIPFAALLWYVRQPIATAALAVNVVILIFYAVIELLDVLLEQSANTDLPLLTTPEFNYGVPLALILVTALGVWLYDSRFGSSRIPE